MVDPIARAFAGCYGIGERRKPSHKATVRLVVSVTVEWPQGIPFTDEDVADVAGCVLSQTCERDVGPIGKIVWAKCYAEMEEDAEVTDVEPLS